MLLDISRVLKTEGERLGFRYELDLSGCEAAIGEYPFTEPVEVSGSVENRASTVRLSMSIRGVCHTRCDRCLRELSEPLDLTYENYVVTQLNEEDNDTLLLIENNTVDLDDLTVTHIILNLPMKHLCREDCKGLCPTCGKDLNDGPCACDHRSIDPRLAVLKELLKEE
ncbi:YceD family protein [Feifania hominis]|uniref:DUF177 domain-containing protein n=1 Tax=Feifania hominis TaxID=2763660 RepID=A0A926DAV7_9FIRM|nr:DUF177 domain-containing protein [Feifania hominis]MBC8535103.1 DUF177 domain-containing protein [Feifania hominis]